MAKRAHVNRRSSYFSQSAKAIPSLAISKLGIIVIREDARELLGVQSLNLNQIADLKVQNYILPTPSVTCGNSSVSELE